MNAMLPELVPMLVCPWCRADGLSLRGNVERNGQVYTGSLICSECPKTTKIDGGIWRAMGPHRRQRSIAQLTNVWPTAIFYESLWRPGALSRFSGRRFPLAEELGELSAALHPDSSSVMVDVACSEGLYARTLAASGASVFAVDHSVPMLKKVVRRSAPQSLRVVAVQAVAQHMPFASGAADGVAIGGSLNEIGERAPALTEMARILSPTGRLFSMHLLKGRTAPGRSLQASLGTSGIVFASQSEWVDAFTTAGLEVETQHVDAIVSRVTLRHTA
jgi:SAM-dependent methyltransferase